MVDIVQFVYTGARTAFRPDGQYDALAVYFEAHRNARFLAAALQEFARQEGCRAWGEDEGDGSYVVRIWDGLRCSAVDLMARFNDFV